MLWQIGGNHQDAGFSRIQTPEPVMEQSLHPPALPRLSVVLPVYDEQDCLGAVLAETVAACSAFEDYEIVAVNDGSTDRSGEILRDHARRNPRIRVLTLTPNAGQSAALWAGFQAVRFPFTATLDADGQNDPRDIAACLRFMLDEGADVCSGIRIDRQDTWSKRVGSRFANLIRRHVLGDGVLDTGCPLKTYRTAYLRRLQYWNGMHRFLPVLCQNLGAKVVQWAVTHRRRLAGTSKYTNLGRLRVTIRDLAGVAWLQSRSRRFRYAEEEVLHG